MDSGSAKDYHEIPASSRVILRRGCPRCGHAIFRGAAGRCTTSARAAAWISIGASPGYFTGAMYVSYALGIPLIALVTLIEYLMIPSWSLFRLVLLAWVLARRSFPGSGSTPG